MMSSVELGDEDQRFQSSSCASHPTKAIPPRRPGIRARPPPRLKPAVAPRAPPKRKTTYQNANARIARARYSTHNNALRPDSIRFQNPRAGYTTHGAYKWGTFGPPPRRTVACVYNKH